MKKTTQPSGPRRRLVLAHETIRRLDAVDLSRLAGGSDAITTTRQASLLERNCTMDHSLCDTTCPPP